MAADTLPQRIREVLETYPIQVGVLFGSHVRGEATAESDVDVAVAIDETDPTERLQTRIDLIADLTRALGTDDIDVVDLETVDPTVGAQALRTGTVLVGDPDDVETLAARFERQRARPTTAEERVQQFDEILDRLEAIDT